MLVEFQRAWTYREAPRCEPCGGLDLRAMMGGVPRVNARLDRQAPDTCAIRRESRRRRRHAASGRADEGSDVGGRYGHGARIR